MKIYNTETGETDFVSNQQATRLIRRTEGLWEEYTGQDKAPKRRGRPPKKVAE